MPLPTADRGASIRDKQRKSVHHHSPIEVSFGGLTGWLFVSSFAQPEHCFFTTFNRRRITGFTRMATIQLYLRLPVISPH